MISATRGKQWYVIYLRTEESGASYSYCDTEIPEEARMDIVSLLSKLIKEGYQLYQRRKNTIITRYPMQDYGHKQELRTNSLFIQAIPDMCEEGCEFHCQYETGTSIYGPDIVDTCAHPRGCGSSHFCPREKMLPEELVQDLFASMVKYSTLAYDLETLIQAYICEQRAREEGSPYDFQRYDTTDKLLAAMQDKIDRAEYGLAYCEGCSAYHPGNHPHVVKVEEVLEDA